MEYLDKNIPREYLALKINYCKKQLEALPKVKLHEHFIDGSSIKRLVVDGHRYDLGSANGKKYYAAWLLRDQNERLLRVYEATWDYCFKGPVPKLSPHKNVRTLLVHGGSTVVMDRNYFDSLKNDANTGYPKPNLYPFNGIQYRSAAEKSIAEFYTDAGIPFKYIDLVMQDRAYWATGIPIDMYRDINIGAITSLYEDLKTSIVIFCVSNGDPIRGPGWRQMTIDEFHDSYSGAYDIFQSDGQRQQVYVSIPGPKRPIGLMIFEWLDESKEIDRGRVIEVTAAFVPRITGLMSVTTK